jgi:hypothetical protein
MNESLDYHTIDEQNMAPTPEQIADFEHQRLEAEYRCLTADTSRLSEFLGSLDPEESHIDTQIQQEIAHIQQLLTNFSHVPADCLQSIRSIRAIIDDIMTTLENIKNDNIDGFYEAFDGLPIPQQRRQERIMRKSTFLSSLRSQR